MRYCKLEDESLYRLYSLYPSHLKGGGSVVTRLDGVVQDFEHLVMVINEFTSRGILMPDPSPGRFSGYEIKTPVFGAGEYSEQLRLLMLEAKELLHM